ERHYASAFVDSGDAVTGIGEPDTAIGMHDDVVRRVETFALELVGYYSNRAVVLIAGYAPRAMLAGELAAFVVESVAVAVVRCLAIFADVAILLEPAHLPVVGDVAPDKVVALAAPRRAFSPQCAGPQALNGRI